MLIPVWGYGYKDFPRTDINSCCVTFQYGSIFQAHPFPFSAPFAWTRLQSSPRWDPGNAFLAWTYLFILSAQVEAKSRNRKVLF
jgi:hypothetical protein